MTPPFFTIVNPAETVFFQPDFATNNTAFLTNNIQNKITKTKNKNGILARIKISPSRANNFKNFSKIILDEPPSFSIPKM